MSKNDNPESAHKATKGTTKGARVRSPKRDPNRGSAQRNGKHAQPSHGTSPHAHHYPTISKLPLSQIQSSISDVASCAASTASTTSPQHANQQNASQQQQQQQQQQDQQQQQRKVNEDYRLLLDPVFSAMTRITDNLFLTGVGGMTRDNFRKNHIDFVVNITTEAPFWEDVESMRVPLEDDAAANILPYLDVAVDRIHEAISRRDAHVLVHCYAGVSRSATIVIAYLMKYSRMDLKSAFNYCYNLRPVVRPNNNFMIQLIHYEQQIFSRSSVHMLDADVDGTIITVPHFFVEEHPRLVLLEVLRCRDQAARTPAGHPTTTTNIK